MSLLVARRWPVPRRAPAAIGLLARSQRSYTQPSGPGIRPLRDRAIIISASVNTKPNQLLSSISVHPERAISNSFFVFFVTPSYASFLFDDDALLNKALRRAYTQATRHPSHRIQALCAVVDKLPVSEPFAASPSIQDEVLRRSTKLAVAGAGLEGIAYVVLPAGASVPSNELLPSDKGAIDFIIAEHKTKNSILRDTLRLPLANTVFQTGKPCTMTLSTWETRVVGKEQPLMKELKLVSKTNVSHHGISLIFKWAKEGPPMSVVSALSIPLVPLTMPRRVEGCMGNIIRLLVGPQGTIIQASSELESVVPSFFASRGQPAQPTVAWALVIPEALKQTISDRTEALLSGLPSENGTGEMDQDETWPRLWRSDPPVWNTLVSKAVAEGARLHRVLSGGGGWGKKAGLLSLDPIPASQVADSLEQGQLPSRINDPEDFASTLTPVVRAGDSIQFFITPKSDLAEEAGKVDSLETLRALPRASPSRLWGWELGTIPNTIDSTPENSWQHAPPVWNGATCFKGAFGALTEGGLTLTRHLKVDGDANYSVSTTTVDVPFSRFSAVHVAEQQDKREEKDVANKSPYCIQLAAMQECPEWIHPPKEHDVQADVVIS